MTGGLVYIAIIGISQTLQPRSLTTPQPKSEEFDEAKRDLDVNDFEKALPLLQAAAHAGNRDAMNNLGDLYLRGQGVPAQDYGMAREWYQKAADAGNTDAMFNLGWLYEKGRGVAQDNGMARKWYQKAVNAGDLRAKSAIARLDTNVE